MVSELNNNRNRLEYTPVGLLDTLLDGLDIERPDTPHVDDLALNTLLGKDLCCLERESDHPRVGDDGDVGSLALDLGLADREKEVGRLGLLGDGEGLAVKDLVLEEDDGVGVTDGGLSLRFMSAPISSTSNRAL